MFGPVVETVANNVIMFRRHYHLNNHMNNVAVCAFHNTELSFYHLYLIVSLFHGYITHLC